jgi:hypothetical protein
MAALPQLRKYLDGARPAELRHRTLAQGRGVIYACPVETVIQWLFDTLTLFNMDKAGHPMLLVALLGRVFLIAVLVLVPIGVVVEINHKWRRGARDLGN